MSATDWREAKLDQARQVILRADPEIVEDRKWVKPTNPDGVAVWSCQGGICTGEMYKKAVKLTFFQGASLPDPHGLFTSSLDGKVRRAVDFGEDDPIDEAALLQLVKEAVRLNREGVS